MRMIPAKKVFVSSTTKDLSQYREEATKVIKKLSDQYKGRFQLVETTMDSEGQDGDRKSAVECSRKWVTESDWIVLIVAWNYGYVAPGQECSVTEWEYRQALKECNPPKTCFVYLAGESSDGDKEYRPLKDGRERGNLVRWKERRVVPEDHWKMLERFKEELRNGEFEIFSDLDNFLALLERSLKNRIEQKLNPGDSVELRHDAQFQRVLHGLAKQIQRCIEEVKLLANLKRIHDRLHKIRQFGIRRWREEVLTQWQEGVLSGEAKTTYFKGLSKVNEYRGRLESFLLQIPDQAGLLKQVKEEIRKVLDTDFEDDPSDCQGFERMTTLYASRVQRAFTETNLAMQERANVLQSCQPAYSSKLGSKPELRPEDEDWITQNMRTLNVEYKDLQSVFIRHSEWQRMHDKLERMDNTKGTKIFLNDLDDFLDSREAMNRLLVDATQIATANGPVENWRARIDDVERYLKALAKDQDEKALAKDQNEANYERMRKAFDDLFYDVDVKTLEAVEKSEQCAHQHSQDLESRLSQVQTHLSGF